MEVEDPSVPSGHCMQSFYTVVFCPVEMPDNECYVLAAAIENPNNRPPCPLGDPYALSICGPPQTAES